MIYIMFLVVVNNLMLSLFYLIAVGNKLEVNLSQNRITLHKIRLNLINNNSDACFISDVRQVLTL